jgi:hypothetical protein
MISHEYLQKECSSLLNFGVVEPDETHRAFIRRENMHRVNSFADECLSCPLQFSWLDCDHLLERFASGKQRWDTSGFPLTDFKVTRAMCKQTQMKAQKVSAGMNPSIHDRSISPNNRTKY